MQWNCFYCISQWITQTFYSVSQIFLYRVMPIWIWRQISVERPESNLRWWDSSSRRIDSTTSDWKRREVLGRDFDDPGKASAVSGQEVDGHRAEAPRVDVELFDFVRCPSHHKVALSQLNHGRTDLNCWKGWLRLNSKCEYLYHERAFESELHMLLTEAELRFFWHLLQFHLQSGFIYDKF